MRGRIAVVTGGLSGVGLETARSLMKLGAHVVVTGLRDKDTERAFGELSKGKKGSVEFLEMDLRDVSSVRMCAGTILGRFESLDVVVACAGVRVGGRIWNGISAPVLVNYLGHFVFIRELLPLIESSPGSRVVIVSSRAHEEAVFDPTNLFTLASSSPAILYATSKLYNTLHALSLQDMFLRRSLTATAFSVHPGSVATSHLQHLPLYSFWRHLAPLCLRTPAEGAQPILRVILSPIRTLAPGGFHDASGSPARASPAVRLENATILWDETERLLSRDIS